MNWKKNHAAVLAQRATSLFRCLSFLLPALLLVACSKQASDKPKPRAELVVPVTVAKVVLAPLDRSIPVVGTLFPKDEAMLSAEVEGRVERTLVDFGDRITNGQLLAQIDTTTYETLDLQADANLARAQASAANSEQDLKRIQQLIKDAIASGADLDKVTAGAEQARAEVKAAEAAQAMAHLNLNRSHVKAPFDAAVAERIGSAGDFVKVGAPLFRVVNDGVLKFIFQVPERNAGDVKKGLPVSFNVDAYPGTNFTGSVYLISPAVNTTTRAFSVGALVQNPDRTLKASTFARGEIIFEHAVPTSVVPLDAVIYFAGVSKVFVVENSIARSRQVEVGRVKADTQEVLSGLKPEETVVVSGHSKLFDGAKVRLKETPKSEIRNPKE